MSSVEPSSGYSCVTRPLADLGIRTTSNGTAGDSSHDTIASDSGPVLSDILPSELVEIYPLRVKLPVHSEVHGEIRSNQEGNNAEDDEIMIIRRLLLHHNHCVIHEPNLSFLWDSTADDQDGQGRITSDINRVNNNKDTTNGSPLLKTVNSPTQASYSSSRLTSLYASVLFPFALQIAMGPMLDYCQGPSGVILCSSRRQCNEVYEILSSAADALQLVVHNVFVGVPIMPESRRADILISTPIRLLGILPTNCPKVQDEQLVEEGDCHGRRNFSASSILNIGDPSSVDQKKLHFLRDSSTSPVTPDSSYYTLAHVSQLISFISTEEVLLTSLREKKSCVYQPTSPSFQSCLKRILINGSEEHCDLLKIDSTREDLLHPCLPATCRVTFIFDGSTVDMCSNPEESTMGRQLPSVQSLAAMLLMDRFNGETLVDLISRPLMCFESTKPLALDSGVLSSTNGYVRLRNASTTSMIQRHQRPDEWLQLLLSEIKEDAEEALTVWINKGNSEAAKSYAIACRHQFRGCNIDVDIYLLLDPLVEGERDPDREMKDGDLPKLRIEDKHCVTLELYREMLLVLASNFNAVIMRGSHCIVQPVIIPPPANQLNRIDEKHMTIDTTQLLLPSLVTEGGILSTVRHFPPYWPYTTMPSERYGSSTFICLRNLSPDVIIAVPSCARSDSEDEQEGLNHKCVSSMTPAKLLSDHLELLTSFSKCFLKHEKSTDLSSSCGSQLQRTRRTERHESASSAALNRSDEDDPKERMEILKPSLLQELLELVRLSSTDIYSFACGFVPIVKDQTHRPFISSFLTEPTVVAFALRCYIETPSWSSAIETILALDGKPLPPDLAVLWDVGVTRRGDTEQFPVNDDPATSARAHWEYDRAATRTLRVEACISSPDFIVGHHHSFGKVQSQRMNQVSIKSSVKEVSVPAVLPLSL